MDMDFLNHGGRGTLRQVRQRSICGKMIMVYKECRKTHMGLQVRQIRTTEKTWDNKNNVLKNIYPIEERLKI